MPLTPTGLAKSGEADSSSAGEDVEQLSSHTEQVGMQDAASSESSLAALL
jgi:hypothetical protein